MIAASIRGAGEILEGAWRFLPHRVRSVGKAIAVIGALLAVLQANTLYQTWSHDQRLVEIYCGARPECADNVSADYVREGRTEWAREAVRIQESEDDAREEACPGGPAMNGGRC